MQILSVTTAHAKLYKIFKVKYSFQYLYIKRNKFLFASFFLIIFIKILHTIILDTGIFINIDGLLIKNG